MTCFCLFVCEQCCGSGSGIQCLFNPWIRNRFLELSDNFLGKKFYNSFNIGPNVFLQHFKDKIVQFCEIYGSKKSYFNKFFFTAVFHCCFWIRDGYLKIRIRDPGYTSRIRNTVCEKVTRYLTVPTYSVSTGLLCTVVHFII